ncbi:hypothetical protein, variant [Blastomyces dermatitidis ATCC 26199]|nr:hypothetical protein BDFG_04635 [Blastomyces dermatitidis ATCC 26199]EQL33189.1 hypothetical protein, variant [Blastomyces dermatitidis ATCC 26199]
MMAIYPSRRQDSKQTREHEHELVDKTNDNPDEPGEPLSKRPRLEPQVPGKLRSALQDAMPKLIQSGVPMLFGDGPYLSFAFMRCHMIEKLPEPFQAGMKTSKLWKEEQQRGGLSVTNCLSLYLPEKINEDALLVVRMGYFDGFSISDTLGLGDPQDSAELEIEDVLGGAIE